MKCTVHIYLLNDDFSQDYADERYEGKESELNRRYEWQDELEIKATVSEVTARENGSVFLRGEMPNGEPFDEEIAEMRILELKDDGEIMAEISCSEVLFESYNVEEKGSELLVHLYLKDREPLSNPVPGVYIAAQKFPKSLVF